MTITPITTLYLITLAFFVGTIATLTLVGLFCRGKRAVALKIAAIALGVIGTFAYQSGVDAIDGAYYGHEIAGLALTDSRGAVTLQWLCVAATIFTVVYPFFFGDNGSAKYINFFAAAAYIADAALFCDLLTSTCGQDISVRAVSICAVLGVGGGTAILNSIEAALSFRKNKFRIKDLLWALVAIAGMLACCLPHVAVRIFIDPGKYAAIKVDDLNLHHRLMIYPAVVIPVILYFCLNRSSMNVKRGVLIFYALAGLINYSWGRKYCTFTTLASLGSLPLHLCNTALYVTPLCLVFKLKRLFYFTYFINVFGAFIALMMPSYSTEGVNGIIVDPYVWHFFRSHYQAFFMPLLTVGLGIFQRPRLKQFIYSIVGFSVYYLFILFMDGLIYNFNPNVDFFFLNTDFVAEKIGKWAEDLRHTVVHWQWGSLGFTYYPIYQLLYFLVYVLLALGMWFLYELCYRSIEGWTDLAARNKKIRMDAMALAASGGEETMDDAASLELKNFSKHYQKSAVYAVKDATLTVYGGEIFGFLGPNGAGKSTIIKSIVGIQPAEAEKIFVCGHDVCRDSVKAKRNIGFVPDHYALYERLTAREYVNYIADLYGVDKADRDRRMEEFVTMFELQAAVDKPIRTYSHGMKQKVAIMAALIHNPKVWILDEPLTGLDPGSIFQVKECMRRHADAGNIVFFSSHLIDVVEKICDRIAIIRFGQIQCVRSVKDIENETALEDFYMNVIGGGECAPVPYEKGEEKPDGGRKRKKKRDKDAEDK